MLKTTIATCWLFWTAPLWVLFHVWKTLAKFPSKQRGNCFFCLHSGLSSSSSSGVVKARGVDKSIIVCRPENPNACGTMISSSDCLLAILSGHWTTQCLNSVCLCRFLIRVVTMIAVLFCGHVCWNRVQRGGIFSSENNKPANLPILPKK